MKKELYTYILKDNVKILKTIFNDRIKENKDKVNELLEELKENNEFLQKIDNIGLVK